LVLLLCATAILGACWALISPAWQAPDEQSHFSYAQTLAEQGRLPDEELGERDSTEQQLAARAVGSDQLAAQLFARPEWSEAAYERWRDRQAELGDGARADGGRRSIEGGANPARTNPPLYYLYEAVPYFAGSGTDLFGRLYLMRLWSMLLLLVTVAATWALAGELLGRRPGLQLVAAAVVGLQPMATFVSASITPDSALIAAFAVALWAGVRVIRRGLTVPDGAALCAAAAVAILVKATGYALLPAVALALVLGARRAGIGSRAGTLLRAAVALLALAVPVGAWLLYARLSERPAINQVAAGDGATIDHPGLFSYLWQFYLPHLPGQQPLPSGFTPLPLRDVWLEGGWGKFGWLEIELPNALYLALGLLTAVLAAGAAAAILRSGLRRHLGPLAFLGLVAAALVGGLHLTEYRILANEGNVFNQGRYLLPLLPLLGLAAAATLSLLRTSWRAVAGGALIGGMVALQLASLAIVGVRFHV
jgi:4-amino-4-deoxy-L-arabinose transferase-like glycosyltransferase